MTTDTARLDGKAMEADTSAHTSTRMSAPRQRIEVITGVERRRRWSREQKRAIVLESERPGASPTAVARKHGIGTGQLYTWRRRLRDETPATALGFVRVGMADGSAPVQVAPSASAAGSIEIALPDGTNIRVGQTVDERALRRVLRVLRDR